MVALGAVAVVIRTLVIRFRNSYVDTLLSLAQDVYRAAWDVRIPFDDKPFKAHITLGRRVDLSSIRLNTIEVEHVAFPASGITLYKSTLRPSGPIYEALEHIGFN